MASSGNFSTFNPLDNATTSGYGTATFGNGNTETTGASTGHCGIASTIATGNTGKYYAEFYLVATSGNAYLGYYSSQQTVTMITASNKWVPNSGVTWNPANLASYFQDGTLYKDGSTTSSWGASFTTGDIIQIAIDADNDAVYYGKNNTWQNSGNPESGASKTGAARTSIPKNIFPAVGHANGGSSTVTWRANFGQDSTFAGTVSAGGNADANGFGDFKYAPPSGYVALSTANLPISDDIDPAQTEDDIPTKQCGVVTYTGTGSSNAITGLGFRPDLVIIKNRPGTQGTKITDSSRGVTKVLQAPTSSAESTDSNGLTAFGSDGFTVGSDAGYNGSSNGMVAWCWKANGGTTASNSDGDITSTVQANTAAGFSIVQYTGVSSATTATVGHGLGKAPTFIIHKVLNSSGWHFVRGVPGMASATTVRDFNPNGSPTDVSGSGGALVAPTTTTFNINNYTGIGGGGYNYVAYCWAPIEGYSKFGVYTGNGNANGPFIYTGFRPRIVLTFGELYGRENFIWDTERSTYNPVDDYLRWGRSSAEGTSSTVSIDILSNGFKVKGTNADYNGDGTAIIYAAWGDAPFKYQSNTF